MAVLGVLLLAACPTPDDPRIQENPQNQEDPRKQEEPPPITYTLTFHANGGSPAPAVQTVTKGGTAAAPGAMTKLPAEGLYQTDIATLHGAAVFDGWYTDTALTTAWSPGAPVTANLNLYAKWTETGTAPPPVDLSGQNGNHTLDRALAYIAAQSLAATYTIVLNGIYTLDGVSSANITAPNAVITLVGRGPTDINLSSNGSLFNIGAGKLILDNHITLRGKGDNNASLVRVDGSSATLVMKAGSTITGNSTSSSGGGVYVSYGGTFTMKAGLISGNTATDDGGGVYVHSGTFTMSGGVISGNNASYGGGGVDAYSGTFTMSGGVISGNNASYGGGGVYVDGTFTMSGGARVTDDNPVCLGYSSVTSYSSLTIGGEFTGPGGPVATIDLCYGTVSDWLGKALLTLDSGYSGDLSDLKSRFSLGNFVAGSGNITALTDYEIDDNGKLQEK